MFIQLVKELFAQVTSIDIDPNLIEVPQDRSMGDFALPCFSLAKEMKKAPHVIAEQLAIELNIFLTNPHPQPLSQGEKGAHLSRSISKVEAVGPYVNVTMDTTYVATQVIQEVLDMGERYGAGVSNDEKLVIESPGPNTNKPLHLGHVRNMLLGNSLADIAKHAGYEVTKVDIVNDRGVHICKSMLAYEKLGNNAEPDRKADHYVGHRYVEYDKGTKGDHPEWETEIQDMLVKWEGGDPQVRALRQKMRDRALDGMHETYERYGCHIDKAYYESDHYLKGKDLVEQGLEQGIFQKNEKGNIVFVDDQENEKAVLRSDGTSIYMTQDIALGKLRYEDWKMDRMVYIVGNEQADHFTFLFKIFKVLGFSFADKCHHLSYGMISLPDGKMKSREGNVVDADNLIDEMQAQSLEVLQERYSNGDNTQLAEDIAFAAIKFFILKYDAKKNFIFDRKESLSFDGESGPYIQYTHARCASVLEKGERGEYEIDYSKLDEDNERLLCLYLSEFGEVVAKAADEYKPSLVARYALELARMFNAYYQSTKILIEDDEAATQARLALVESVQQVLKIGLGLLGIEAPEKM